MLLVSARTRCLCDPVKQGTNCEREARNEEADLCGRGEFGLLEREAGKVREWRGWGRRVVHAFGIWEGRAVLVVGPGRCESETREGQNRERGTVETAEKKRD